MSDWSMVQWSRARQITQAMGIKEKDAKTPALAVTPPEHFASLLALNKQVDAVQFLAHALPRYEAIQWAAQAMAALRPNDLRDLDEARAFDTAHQWLRDPTETLRRAAEVQFQAMDEASPEKFLLQAIFLSGGSMAPEDLPPVHPLPEITAKLAAAAILVTAFATPDPTAALTRALQDGEKLAQRAS